MIAARVDDATIWAELTAAGVAGLPFSWTADGTPLSFDLLTPEQLATVNAVFAAHAGPAAPTQAQLIAATRKKAAELRFQIASILSELQIDALVSADQATATTIKGLKDGLAAIVNMDLSAYNTAEQMEQAIWLAYWGIVSQAPQEVQDAFNALVPR